MLPQGIVLRSTHFQQTNATQPCTNWHATTFPPVNIDVVKQENK